MATHYPAINETIQAIIDFGLAEAEQIKGCTPEQIREVEERYHVKFPKIYREYLSVLGCGAGRYQGDVESGYPVILELGERARELMEEDEATITLPDDAFVFSMYLGFQFMFFHADGLNDDPPIYLYSELSNKFVPNRESFSRLLRDIIEQFHAAHNKD